MMGICATNFNSFVLYRLSDVVWERLRIHLRLLLSLLRLDENLRRWAMLSDGAMLALWVASLADDSPVVDEEVRE